MFHTIQMDCYNCSPSIAASLAVVPLGNVLITPQIATAIKKTFGVKTLRDISVLKHIAFKSDPTITGFVAPLNRLTEMLEIMSERKIPLPPIEVSIIKSTTGEYFQIINGRHRFAASIILGYNSIPIVRVD